MNSMIKSENLTFGYAHGAEIINNLHLTLGEGDIVGLLGPNGAGKSTLLRLLSGFLKPISGSVYIDTYNIANLSSQKRAELLAVVSQDHFSVMPYTVRQIVSMGRVSKVSRFMPFQKSDVDIVDSVMSDMDVIQFENRQFNTLSGGEKQRVKLAAALAQEPKILLLDEPTSQLDMGHAVKLMHLIQKLNRDKRITTVIVSHDIQLMSSFIDRIVMMKEGRVIADGQPEKIIDSEIIRAVYNCNAEIYRDSRKRIHIFPGITENADPIDGKNILI